MPKLRHGDTDEGKVANWIGRKIKNHNAVGELTMTSTTRAAKPRMYSSPTQAAVYQVGDAENVVFADLGGRAVKVTVEFVDGMEYDQLLERKTKLLTA